MHKQAPSWIELLRRYKNENKRYISNNRRRLFNMLFVGIGSAVLSILLSFLSLPGGVFTYYLIFLFITSIIGSSNNNKSDSFAVSLSVDMSTLVISVMTGVYMISIFNGQIEGTGGIASYLTTVASVLIVMPLYSLSISLIGVAANDTFEKLKNNLTNTDEEQIKNQNKQQNNTDKEENSDLKQKSPSEKQKSLN